MTIYYYDYLLIHPGVFITRLLLWLTVLFTKVIVEIIILEHADHQFKEQDYLI